MAPTSNAARTVFGALASLLPRGSSPRRPDLEKELEEARRLGHWFTEEDRQLVREHEARLASERRGVLVRRAGQSGAVALMVLASVLPLLWPVAILGGVKAFPRTSRKVGLGLVAITGLGLLLGTLAVVQLGKGLLTPATPPAAVLSPGPSPLGGGAATADNALGNDIAERLNRATDYWTLEGTSPDGSATYRKGLYRSWNGQTVMVLPRTTWTYLSPSERRALARYGAADRGVAAIHVGRVVPSTAFAGNTITVEERVWP